MFYRRVWCVSRTVLKTHCSDFLKPNVKVFGARSVSKVTTKGLITQQPAQSPPTLEVIMGRFTFNLEGIFEKLQNGLSE